MDQKKAAMIAAICGAVVFIGVLLPWWSWSFDPGVGEVFGRHFGVSTTISGTQYGSGTFTLILGLAGGIAAALVWKGKTQGLPLNARQLTLASVGCFGLGAVLTLIDVMRTPGGYSGPGGSGGKGIGIWLTLLGAAAGAYAAWMMMKQTPAPAPGAPPPAAPPTAPPPPVAPPPAATPPAT